MIESNDSSISFEVESQFPDHNGLRWVMGLAFLLSDLYTGGFSILLTKFILQVSVGEFGNSMSDSADPVNSSTPFSQPLFDGEKYYYCNWDSGTTLSLWSALIFRYWITSCAQKKNTPSSFFEQVFLYHRTFLVLHYDRSRSGNVLLLPLPQGDRCA